MQQANTLEQYELKNQKTDFYLFNAEIFTQAEIKALEQMKAYLINIKTDKHNYQINTRYFFNSSNTKTPVFCLHGHGSDCTWAAWLKMAFLLFIEDKRNIILIDLPAYGKSGVDNKDRINPKYYLEDFPQMFVKFLDLFQIEKVHAIGWCGGGASFYRTICQYPKRFAKTHIFHNVVISEIPKNFQEILEQNQMKIWVSWCLDDDHSQYCVGYKWLALKKRQKSKNILFENISDDELPLLCLWSKKMGRNMSDICMFDISKGYQQFALDFINGRQTIYQKNPVQYEWIPPEIDEEIKKLSKLDANSNQFEEQIQLALALSLSEMDSQEQFKKKEN